MHIRITYILIQFMCILYNKSMHILYNLYASLHIIYKFTMYYIYIYMCIFIIFLPFICQNCIWVRSGFLNSVIGFGTSQSPWWHIDNFLAFSQCWNWPCPVRKETLTTSGQLVLAQMLMTPSWQLFESYWFVMVNHCPQIHSHRCLSNCFTMGSLCKVFTPNTLQKHIN